MRPLNYAVYNKYMIACHLLIEHGADINAIVNDGKTIVEYEISKCNIKAVEILRELGAKTAYELEQEKMKGR